MKFHPVCVAAFLAFLVNQSEAFSHGGSCRVSSSMVLKSTTAQVEEMTSVSSKRGIDNLTVDIISKLRFREVQRELERRQLDTSGTFTSMRERLRHVAMAETNEENSHDNAASSQQSKNDAGNVRVIDEDSLNSVGATSRLGMTILLNLG
jgi:hypothetical protein